MGIDGVKRKPIFPHKQSVERINIEISNQPQITILGAAAHYYDAQLRLKRRLLF
jgi:hypothetical protein